MTLAEALLPRLAEWQPEETGPARIAVDLSDHGWTVELTAERVESLGCQLTGIVAKRRSSLEENDRTLEANSRRAAGRATGLLEPLRFIEIDRARHVALLRSDAPPSKGNDVLFYEVEYQGLNRVQITRQQASKSSPAAKKAIPFALTHEAVAKLVDDLTRE